MSLGNLARLRLPKTLAAYRDQLVAALKEHRRQDARNALEKLAENIAAPRGTARSFMMFDKPVSLKDLASCLNQLEPNFKQSLFSSETAAISSDVLQETVLLNRIALEAQSVKFQALLAERQKHGFKQFLADLQDEKYNQTHASWALNNGMLTVKPGFLNAKKTISEIHQFLAKPHVLGSFSWYEQPVEEGRLDLFHAGFKTLGKKINKAVDPVFILKGKDGFLKVLCGVRRDGSYAFPGGMNESSVMQTCIDELLQECFSGDLFKADSLTEALINTKDDRWDLISEIIKQNFLNLLATVSKPKPCTPNYVKQMVAYKNDQSQLNTKLKALLPAFNASDKIAYRIQQFCEIIRKSDIDKGRIEPLIAHIKCDIYKQCLPEQYLRFEQYVKDKMHKEPLVMNKSDPRNTDLGAMYTNPLEAIVDEQELTDTLKESCALSYDAGDYLGNVGYRTIEIFASNPYSDHASLLVQAISRGIQRGEITYSEQVRMQVHHIAEHFNCVEALHHLNDDISSARIINV